MSKNGFTLVEMLVVVGLVAVLTVISLPIYTNLQVSTQLNETAAQLTQSVRVARERSLVRYNNSSHGVKFESDRYIIYQGESFATRQIGFDREIMLAAPISLSPNFISSEVNFTKSFGLPSATGTIIVTHNVNGSRNIIINELGLALEQ